MNDQTLAAGTVSGDETYTLDELARRLGHAQTRTTLRLLERLDVPVIGPEIAGRGLTLISGFVFNERVRALSRTMDARHEERDR